MPKQQTEFTLGPRGVTIFLSWVLLFLVSAHLSTHLFRIIFRIEWFHLVESFFNLNTEKNAPTLFSIGLFVISSTLFLMVWKGQAARKEPQRVWMILSGVFCFLAIDELAMIHERLIDPLRSMLGTSGFFSFAWVIPYGVAIMLLSIYVIPVIWRIEKKSDFGSFYPP
jgi:hypothetical protein